MASSVLNQPVVSGTHLRQPSGGAAQDTREGYHFGEDITDKAIEFIMDAKAVAPEKPFFLYYAPGACPRAAPRPQGLDRKVSGPLRHGI